MRAPGWIMLPLLALALLVPQEARAGAPVPAPLAERALAGGTVRVLVRLDVPFAPEGVLASRTRARQRVEIARAQSLLADLLADAPPLRRRDFGAIPWSSLTVDARGLARLAASPLVTAIQEDRLQRPLLNTTRVLVEADQTEAAGFDGLGQTVVVVDTGIDFLHPSLAGKSAGAGASEACFAEGENPGPNGDCPNGQDTMFGAGAGIYCDFSDGCGHGTHVANIAAGAGVNHRGIAPGAQLVSIQAFSAISNPAICGGEPTPCPRNYESDEIAALEYVFDTLRFQYTLAAVNLSLGGVTWDDESQCDADNAAVKSAVDNLVSVGIAVIAAAGNDDLDGELSAPACISSVVSVGATERDDTKWNPSNHASFLDLWAPGRGIGSAKWQSTNFTSQSGTSQATAFVSGAFAVLRHAWPAASIPEMLTSLRDTGVPIPDNFSDTSRILIHAALLDLGPDCDDGVDNDGDGLADGDDPGCAGAGDESEQDAALACDNGLDDDGDGLVDTAEDPGCLGPMSPVEDPACDDGVDNDGDGDVDLADAHCAASWDNSEKASSCGLGVELALLLPLLGMARRRRRSPAA